MRFYLLAYLRAKLADIRAWTPARRRRLAEDARFYASHRQLRDEHRARREQGPPPLPRAITDADWEQLEALLADAAREES